MNRRDTDAAMRHARSGIIIALAAGEFAVGLLWGGWCFLAVLAISFFAFALGVSIPDDAKH